MPLYCIQFTGKDLKRADAWTYLARCGGLLVKREITGLLLVGERETVLLIHAD
jgi:hypothetical protein